MKSLEFFSRVSIGRYIERDSAVHRLSPAAKYLWLFAFILPVSAIRSVAAMSFLAAAAIAAAALAKIRPSYLLRGFLPVLPLVGIAAAFQIVFTSPGDKSAVLLAIGPVSVTLRELAAVGGMALRFLAMMLGLGLFTSVITEGDTARGIEDVLSPLAKLGFPAHQLALAVAVAFRFIPIVAGELEGTVKAQAARGADFGTGKGGPLRRARAYLPLVVPVTIRALERAEALAEAMEARCYEARGRTRYVKTEGGRYDLVARLAAIAFAGASLALDAALPW